MSRTKESFELRILGKHLSKETLGLSDLSDVLSAFEKTLLPVMIRDNPEMSDFAVISLNSLVSGSIKIRFVSPAMRAAVAALMLVSSAIEARGLGNLPEESRKAIETLVTSSRKKNWTIEFRSDPSNKAPLARITPESDLSMQRNLVAGHSTIYGTITRVGGATEPKVQIQPLNGRVLNCSVDRATAKQLGEQLYSMGCFWGKVWRDPDHGFEIVDFQIEKAERFHELQPSDAFKGLRSLIGEYFANVDPEEYVAKLRRDE
jgi:hypothetical protein